MPTSAIIVAAGTSERMGFDKLFADLAGHPVLWHSVRAFENCEAIDEIIIVTSATHRPRLLEWEINPDLSKLAGVVEGGAERYLSVQAGLDAVAPETSLIAVHDGARPLIDPAAISRCLERARETGAAACARRLTDTVKRADATGRVIEAVDREGLWAMETPQAFAAALLRDAYAEVIASETPVTDEVSALERRGVPVHLVETLRPNPKITFPQDLALAARLLAPDG